MKMHYKKSIGIFAILMGALEAGIYFMIGIGSSSISLLVPGLIAVLLGILFLQRTYFVANDDNLVFHALLGPSKKTYKFSSLKEFEIKNNDIFVTVDGKRQRFISGWWVENKDWQEFLQKINAAL